MFIVFLILFFDFAIDMLTIIITTANSLWPRGRRAASLQLCWSATEWTSTMLKHMQFKVIAIEKVLATIALHHGYIADDRSVVPRALLTALCRRRISIVALAIGDRYQSR